MSKAKFVAASVFVAGGGPCGLTAHGRGNCKSPSKVTDGTGTLALSAVETKAVTDELTSSAEETKAVTDELILSTEERKAVTDELALSTEETKAAATSAAQVNSTHSVLGEGVAAGKGSTGPPGPCCVWFKNGGNAPHSLKSKDSAPMCQHEDPENKATTCQSDGDVNGKTSQCGRSSVPPMCADIAGTSGSYVCQKENGTFYLKSVSLVNDASPCPKTAE